MKCFAFCSLRRWMVVSNYTIWIFNNFTSTFSGIYRIFTSCIRA
nr:MAG TPA: hypothetical protein [Caudoviricetes sp.]